MPAVDPLLYRRVAGRFTTGITVVTTRDAEGSDHAMTVSSFTSVSLDPILALFCCEKVARFHAAVLGSGWWGVSVLAAEQEELSRWFATRGRPFARQFDSVPTTRGAVSNALLFTEALSTLECRTVATYDGGDHTIVLGEVMAARLPRLDGAPLLYYEGRYRGIEE